ncbi:formin-1-like isoform X2 [Zophobas morio]|uniref:formin-1-like isoform X2 n=1 Tax=Zophobas morio TaxID=2755281 RepID=UPI0030838F76
MSDFYQKEIEILEEKLELAESQLQAFRSSQSSETRLSDSAVKSVFNSGKERQERQELRKARLKNFLGFLPDANYSVKDNTPLLFENIPGLQEMEDSSVSDSKSESVSSFSVPSLSEPLGALSRMQSPCAPHPSFSSPPPPPPPPPPSLFSSKRAYKHRHRKRMKSLFWTRLRSNPSLEKNCLWNDMKQFDFDFGDIAERFSITSAMSMKERKTHGLKKVVRVLDERKSRSLGIIYKNFERRSINFKQALTDLSDHSVEAEEFQKLLSLFPTEEDLASLRSVVEKNQSGFTSGEVLEEGEAFILETAGVPFAREKLKVRIFQASFSDKIYELNVLFRKIRSFCLGLRCKGIKTILGIILCIGNFMNEGNSSIERAWGFTIDVLTKLKLVKTVDGKSNLLELVVEKFFFVETNLALLVNLKFSGGELPFPLPDPELALDLSRCEFKDIDSKVADLNSQLKRLRNESTLQQCQTDFPVEMKEITALLSSAEDEASLHFSSEIIVFLETAGSLLEELAVESDLNRRLREETAFYFGYCQEEMNTLSWEDFFQTWAEFLKDAHSCWKKENRNIDKQIFEQIQIKRRHQKANVSTRKQSSKSKMKSKFSLTKR